MRKFILASVFSLVGMCFSPLQGEETEKHEHKEHSRLEYGSFFTKRECLVAPEHAVIFDHETVCSTRGIEHPDGTGDFIIKEPGIYLVTYSASLKDAGGLLALALDGVVVQGSEMYIGVCDQLSTRSFLVKICGHSQCCHHVLRVINNFPLTTGWYCHDINLKAGGYDAVTAGIIIEKVACCTKECRCCREQQ